MVSSKLHGFIKANGDMHEHGSVPKHLSYWAEKGYIAGIYVGFVERLASGF